MALEVRNLYKRYPPARDASGGFSVQADFTVEPGETLVLAGPSGCGKTTILNLIAGLVREDGGSVLIDGAELGELPPWKRNISIVFQDLALFPHLNVGQNIAYGPFIHRIPRSERRRIVEETLSLVRLGGYEKRRIPTLSGGERQRIAIARALAVSPRLLLLDEPFSSLDAPLRRELRREFLEIRKKAPVPCVFVTHDREEAAILGDRIALMHDGRIIETGTGRDLFLRPKTEFGARFFASGQVLPCVIEGAAPEGNTGGKGTLTGSALGKLWVPGEASPGLEYDPARPLLFVPRDALIPAERITGSIAHTGEAASLAAITAIFKGALFEGERVTLELELPGGIPFAAEGGLRGELPAKGSPMRWYVDQSLLRFLLPYTIKRCPK